MEFLLSNNPIIQSHVHTKSIQNYFNGLVNDATNFNIATGYITNDSIAALKQIVEFRQGEMSLSLFIGMHYIEGFTELQYKAISDLSSYLKINNIGEIFLSQKALFHGKLYSFMRESKCLASFVGSSNLGSFVGTSQNNIEADLMFKEDKGKEINSYIKQITDSLGINLSDLPTITKFRPSDIKILSGYTHVKEVSKDCLDSLLRSTTGQVVDIPLKTEAKSNLNTYFGKGKIKGKYSPRGWYEVEIILGKNLENRSLIPTKDDGSFTVVTTDGYEFQCSTQGDYSKNFRSDFDLKILGRWIKGQMENAGALEIGKPVTEETLEKFGKRTLRLEKTNSGVFILSLEP